MEIFRFKKEKFNLEDLFNEAKNKYEDLTIQKRIVSLKLNQTTNINYTSNISNDKKYYSDNREVAIIDSKGNITAKRIGSTTIVGEESDGDKLETIVIVYRDLLEPLSEISKPRFTLKDGVYVNEDAKETNEALLMFTGDLMCQTRQQEAAKTEDGTYVFNDSFNIVKNVFLSLLIVIILFVLYVFKSNKINMIISIIIHI